MWGRFQKVPIGSLQKRIPCPFSGGFLTSSFANPEVFNKKRSRDIYQGGGIMRKFRILSLWVFLSLFVSMAAWGGVSDMANSLIKADAENQPIPVLSKTDPNLDAKTAYEVQKGYVQWRMTKDKMAGFKGGLTTEAAQKRFGVSFPVTGVLYASGKLEGSPVLDKTAFRMMMIETEIGFVINQPIQQTLRDVQELQQKVGAVMPSIELPDFGFADMKVMKGVDVIAANCVAAKFIAGTPRPHQGVNLNEVSVTLYYNGQALYQGKGAEAMGDQWKAALWMINSIVEQGYRIEPGHILITGALGQMVPGKPGQYVADYGDFGKISFEIK
jgi:2-keto-4-pentenoate hydratase